MNNTQKPFPGKTACLQGHKSLKEKKIYELVLGEIVLNGNHAALGNETDQVGEEAQRQACEAKK